MTVLEILLEDLPVGGSRNCVADFACNRFRQSQDEYRKIIWLTALFSIDGFKGLELLTEWVEGLPSVPEKEQTMIIFCKIFIDHGDPCFKMAEYDYERIEVLKKLVPYIYRYVNPGNDVYREGVYTPNDRDHAERTRSHLMSKISGNPGRPSYDALIELSKSDECRISKDYLEYAAKERAALDAEFSPWSGQSVYEFRMSAEKAPESERDLFMMALDRLDDFRMDIEDGDNSPAGLLQKEEKEYGVRIFLARELIKMACSRYSVSSEEELADRKRTDLRIHVSHIPSGVPIELKIADKWTFVELRERLENQLIGQYMRVSRYGIFLLVFNGTIPKKPWTHPDTKKDLSLEKMVEMLNEESKKLAEIYPNVETLKVIGIDFTARFNKKDGNHGPSVKKRSSGKG